MQMYIARKWFFSQSGWFAVFTWWKYDINKWMVWEMWLKNAYFVSD